MTVVLIKEITMSGNISVHQVHTKWENAKATLRETFSACKGLTMNWKHNGTVNGLPEEFVTVTYDQGDTKAVQMFGVTEMPLFDCVDHL